MKNMMWLVIVIALLVGGVAGYMIAKSQAAGEMMMVKEQMQEQIDQAKMQNEAMIEEEKMEPTGMMLEDEKDAMMSEEEKMMESSN